MATLDLGKVVGTDGKSATLEITGAQSLPYGSQPTVTEGSGSTALSRKYVLGIPEGKPGSGTPSGSGADINDDVISPETTYSSQKIESSLNELKEKNDAQDEAIANAGKVKSVNGKTGEVTLNASDVGALPSDGTAADANKLGGVDAEEYLLEANALNMKLIWPNASPTSTFGEVNLTDLDFAAGDMVTIVYKRKNDSTMYRSVSMYVQSSEAYVELFNAWSSIFTTRNVAISPGVISFSGGQSSVYGNTGTLTQDNSVAIPVYVFVQKGVRVE